MITVTRSAMLVVSRLIYRLSYSLSDIVKGLYHKLHGITRPVTMKKSTIKRRKRVVPVNQEPLQDQLNIPPLPTSVSPEPAPAPYTESNPPFQETSSDTSLDMSINLGFRPRESRADCEPPPIDFTGYQRNRSSQRSQETHIHNGHQHSLRFPSPSQKHSPQPHQNDPDHNRKRSFSTAEGTHIDSLDLTPDALSRSNRLSSISSLLNPTKITSHPSTDDSMIDPDLTRPKSSYTSNKETPDLPLTPDFRSPQIEHQEDPGGGHGLKHDAVSKTARKARLKREAEELREQLRAKEREFEELNECDDDF